MIIKLGYGHKLKLVKKYGLVKPLGYHGARRGKYFYYIGTLFSSNGKKVFTEEFETKGEAIESSRGSIMFNRR